MPPCRKGQNFLHILFILQNSALSCAKHVPESSCFGKHDIKEILLLVQCTVNKLLLSYSKPN